MLTQAKKQKTSIQIPPLGEAAKQRPRTALTNTKCYERVTLVILVLYDFRVKESKSI